MFLDSWLLKIAFLIALLALHFAFCIRWRPASKSGLQLQKEMHEFLPSAALIFTILLGVIQPFIAQAYSIPTGSMENTLPVGNRVLASKLVYRISAPKAGDVVVFHAPRAALHFANMPEGTLYIKRCVGAPGQVVEVRNRVLWRDGKVIAEPYTFWGGARIPAGVRISYDLKIVGGEVYSRPYDLTGTLPGAWEQNGIPVAPDLQNRIIQARAEAVPSDHYLMLGDHRSDSSDGHVWGFVPREKIVGRAFGVFWPPQSLGLLDVKSR